MTSATPTHYRPYNCEDPSTSEFFSQLKSAYSARNGAPKMAEEPYLRPFCDEKERNAQASAVKGFSRAETHPPPPISHLFC